MKKNLFRICSSALLVMSSQAFASNTATQTLTLQVPISQSITVSSSMITLTIASLDSMGNGNSPTDTSSTYDVSATVDSGVLKITGGLDMSLPADSSVQVTLASTAGTSTGAQIFLPSTTGTLDLVTGLDTTMGAISDSGEQISLSFGVGTGYTGGASLTRTITYTVTPS